MHLYDAQNQGGPEYAYRLRISPPRPDFELRVVPSGLTVRAGTAVPITVHALRRDGFNGPIDLELKDAPAGFSLSGATVPAGQEKVRLTLSVPRPTRPPMTLRMEGRAAIAGREVRRPVVPADDMMQAYFYHHLVAAQEWLIDILANGQPSVPFQPRDLKAVILPSGGTAEIHFVGPHGPLMQTVQLTLSEPPDGLSIQRVCAERRGRRRRGARRRRQAQARLEGQRDYRGLGGAHGAVGACCREDRRRQRRARHATGFARHVAGGADRGRGGPRREGP